MNLKKIIALALCICMVLSFFPVSVFAEDWEDEVVLVDEEEYFEPQDEYVEEEIIEEEPVDYAEYVEPAEELIVEDEDVLVEEESELIEEPAEEPAAPAEEPAAAMTAELKTAETFGAAPTANSVAKIGNRGYDTIDEALADALTGEGTIELLKDIVEPVVLAQEGQPVIITGNYAVRSVRVYGDAKSLALSVKSIDELTVLAGNVTLTNTTVVDGVVVNGPVRVTGGKLSVIGGELKSVVTISGGEVDLNTYDSSEDGIIIEAGALTISNGTYDTVLVSGTGNITGNITGGTFGRVSKALLADGYVTTDFDSTKSYGTGTVSPTDKEAMVGTAATGRSYGSLADLAGGTEVPKLLKDASYALTESNPSLKVKLNEHVVNFNLPAGTYAKVDGPVVDGVTTYTLTPCVAIVEIAGVPHEVASLKEAVEMINDSTGLEGVITLCDNINMGDSNLGSVYTRTSGQLILVSGAKVTINGGNDKHSISWGHINEDYALFPAMLNNVELTIQNVVLTGLSANTKVFSTYSGYYGQTATLSNCEFKNIFAAAYLNDAAGQTQTVNITNSTFDADCQGFLGCNGASGNLNIAVTGNEFKAESLELCSLPEGSTFNISNNDFSAVESITVNYSNKVNVSGNYWGGSAPEVTVAAGWQGTGATLIVDTFQATEGATETTTCEAYLETIVSGATNRKYYATFADAAADANGNVIFLENNVAATYALSDGETLKVKHNGKTLNVTFNGNMVFGDLDEQTGVTTYVSSASAVAQIKDAEGNVKGNYRTFDDALSHAEANDVIVLKKDGTWTGEDPTKVPAFKVTIDIGGTDNTLTIEGAHQFENNSDVTIRNGNVFVTGKKTTNGANVSWGIFTDYYNGSTGTKLAFDNVTLTTATGITGLIGFDNGLTLNIKDSDLTVDGATHFAFYTYGSNVTIDNSEVKVLNSLTAVKPAGWPAEGAFDYGTYNITKSKIRVDGALNAAFYGINGTIAGSEITASVQASTAVDAHGNTKNNPGVFVQAESDNLTISNTTLNLTSGTGSAFAENNTDTDKVPILILNNATVTCGEGTVSGIVANVAVEGVTRSFTIFAEAAAYAFANDAVVDLQAAPAPGDAYPLTGNNTLQVKLNSFVTDATVLATAPEGKRVDASQPVDGVVTLSLADQKYNVSRLVSGHPEVVAWYKTFDLALADVQYGDGQFIVIKESHEHAFTAEGKRAMYVKAEGEGVAFTYTTPVGYEVKTRLDGSGSESTLYELTPITYTLTYDYDDATTTPENPATYTVETETFTLNAPEKTNYGFDGWYVDGAEEAFESVTITKGSTGNHSYKAKWVGNALTVTIDGKGGVTTDSESVIVLPKHYGDAFAITDYADTFTRSHYHQTGWFNHTTGNTYIPSTVTYNFTLEATWAEDTYTVKFDKNDDAATGTMADESFNYSEEKALTNNAFTKTGYTFAGWAESADGEVVYTNGQSVKELVENNGGEKTLYAKWSPISYDVTFNANAPTGTTASGTMTDQKFTYDVPQKLTANAFVIPGYTFTGWVSDMALSYTDQEEVKNLRSTIGDARKLNAQWSKDTYTITFVTGDGNPVEPMTYAVDSTSTIPAATYPNGVMAFNGWKVTAVGEKGDWTVDQNVAADTVLTNHYGDVTLTAQWIDAEAHLKDKADNDYYGTIDEMVDFFQDPAHSDWWPEGQNVELVRDNMSYTLAVGQTLTVNVNGKTFTTLPASKAGETSTTAFTDGYYATPGVPDEHGNTTTFGTAHYVAQVRTDNWTYTINPNGTESDPVLASSSYKLYETFATAANYALALDTTHSGGKFQTATVMLLTANPVTYELKAASLGNGHELRVDIGGFGGPNLKAEEGARIDVKNISGTEYRYSLVETVTVTFDMNGKTATAPLAPLTIDKGTKATKPATDPTTTDGYTFTKWYAEAACTTEFDFNDAIIEDTTIYAGWVATQYNITYTGGAYTNPNADTTYYTVENRDSITFADAVSYGWHFDGWKLNGALLQNGKLPAGTMGEITLEATWSKNNYDVTFVTPADVPTPDAQRVPYNTKATKPDDPDRDYYQFNGWYKHETPEEGETAFDFGTPITEATTLYAIYTPTEYTITYYLNGGSLEEGVTNPTTYTVETETFTLKNPTKANWTFDGWTGSNSQDPGQSTVTITKGSHDDLEFGAHYKYTATFVMNGGTPEVPAQTNMERVLVTKPADNPTLADATFEGWYADAALTQEFDFTTAPNGNVTIYAKFVGEPRSIVFMDDDYTHRIFQTLDKHVGDTLPAYVPDSLPTRTGYALDETDLWNPSIFDDQGNLKKVTTDQIFNLKWKQLFNVDFEVNDVVIESIGDIVSGSTIAKDDMPVVRKDGKVAKWVDKVTGEEFIFADGTVENPTQVTANLVLVASFDDTPATLADFTYNMSLTENLNMKFYVRNVKDDFHNYTVKVSIDGEDDQFFYLDNAEENIIPIAEFDATRMTDKIHVVVTDGDTEALDEFYTIAGYCNAVIESTGNEKLKELANAILVYGANAQLALDYKTGNLPTEDHDVSGVIIPAATAKTKGSVTGVSRFGNQVMVDSYVTLRVLLQVDSKASLDDYTVTVNDTEVVPVKQSATIWYVDIPVSALKLGERQIVYVEDDDGMATYALTTIVPMKRVNNDLARALYAYYDAATAYATSI